VVCFTSIDQKLIRVSKQLGGCPLSLRVRRKVGLGFPVVEVDTQFIGIILSNVDVVFLRLSAGL
jgi:hypothetical protein